jgi:hypothetical protein
MTHPELITNHRWYQQRIEDEDGEIYYEAHGPNESFITFYGPRAVNDIAIFMAAVNK